MVFSKFLVESHLQPNWSILPPGGEGGKDAAHGPASSLTQQPVLRGTGCRACRKTGSEQELLSVICFMTLR